MFNQQVIAVALICGTAACTSNTADEGSGSTISVGTLLSLERQGIQPAGVVVVYEDGSWNLTSHDACAVTEGKLTETEVAPLHQYLADPALKMLPAQCSNRAFVLRGQNLVPMGCWDDSQNAIAPMTTSALAKFFDDRASSLHWDGTVKDCPEQGPPGINSSEIRVSPNSAMPPPARK